MLRLRVGWPEQRNMVDAVSALVLNHRGRDRDVGCGTSNTVVAWV